MPGQWITRIALLLALGVVGFGGEGVAASTPAGDLTYAMHVSTNYSASRTSKPM